MKENPNTAPPPSRDPPTDVTGVGSDPFIGKVLDNRYKILSLIARGGMGRVFRAEQAPLGRVVALKVLDLGKGNDQDTEMRKRFMLEAATCSRLTHPNTVRIFDYGRTWDDILYIAMEYLDGVTLHQAIRMDSPMEPERVVHIARQVCRSLREAHGAGLIHRDLKPSNVILTRTEEEADFVKLLDFGLVRQVVRDTELTHADAVVGSPSYMSPEQIRGEHVDQRSDIYSVGILLYACITGRTPFAGESSVKVMMAHLNTPPPPMAPFAPQLARSPTLEWVVLTALAKDAADRFASVDELIRALKVADAELRGETTPRPVLVDGKLSMPDEWVSQPSISGMASPGAISGSGVRVRPVPREGGTNEGSVSSLARLVAGRRVPIIVLTAAFLALLVLGAIGLAAIIVGMQSRSDSTATTPKPDTTAPKSTSASSTPTTPTTTPTSASPAAATPGPTPAAEPAAATPATTTPAAAPAKKPTPSSSPTTTPAPSPPAGPKASEAPATDAAPPAPATSPTTTPTTTPASTPPRSDIKNPWGNK